MAQYDITIPPAAAPFLLGASLDSRMSCREMAALVIVARNPGASIRHLAAATNMPKPCATRAIDNLEEMKLVSRQRDMDDMRSVQIRVTDAGAEIVRGLGRRKAA